MLPGKKLEFFGDVGMSEFERFFGVVNCRRTCFVPQTFQFTILIQRQVLCGDVK